MSEVSIRGYSGIFSGSFFDLYELGESNQKLFPEPQRAKKIGELVIKVCR